MSQQNVVRHQLIRNQKILKEMVFIKKFNIFVIKKFFRLKSLNFQLFLLATAQINKNTNNNFLSLYRCKISTLNRQNKCRYYLDRIKFRSEKKTRKKRSIYQSGIVIS